MMPKMTMPAARDFGWALKPVSSTFFDIHRRANGQFCVILHHALLRGCRAEMLHWWFLNFTRLTVRLPDTPGYVDRVVPAYWLWHPSDHVSATLSGAAGATGQSPVGASIRIREAMQYEKFGWRYPVDTALRIFYCAPDGWAMGKPVPLVGPAMMLRIHFSDVTEGHTIIGVRYHYEIVVGIGGPRGLAHRLNPRITREFSPAFFEAWQTHNTVEVGAFENFLPALYAQRDSGNLLEYRRDMNPIAADAPAQTGCDRALFERRVHGYAAAEDAYAFQAYASKSAL